MQTINARYSDSDLQEFKLNIKNKLQEAEDEANYLQSRLDDMERQADSEGGHSFGEDSKNHEDRQFMTRMYERQMEKVHALKLALTRIANKTYGVDEDTGDLISKERLMAMPTAKSDVKK